jgi:hypothetical protein
MTTTTDTRSNWRTWSPSYETAPPAACQTLRNLNNIVEWGATCVFGEEDGPAPFFLNTACMPWVTPNIYPNTAAFYSPATACPTSWAAVSTATSGNQWVNGETGLTCCPPGFEGDGRGGCKVGTATYPAVECGEADAEENNNRVYTSGQLPPRATASITALKLRYQASDIGSASATRSSPANTGSGSNGNGSGNTGGGGLSTGAKAAIGTVIPLVFIIGAFAFALLWRRRKQKKAAMALAARNADEKDTRTSGSVTDTAYHPHPQSAAFVDSKHPPLAAGVAAAGHPHRSEPHINANETPEWNVEMDATEAERQGLVANQYQSSSATPSSAVPNSALSNEPDTSELAGTARMQRKPIAPVEMDGTGVRAEVGDAYIPYRPGV